MRWLFAAILALSLSAPAAAQYSQRFDFFKAVKKGDAAEVQTLASQTGTLVNTRDPETGGMALHIVTERTDAPWINFLQQQGADVNVRDEQGNTPLMIAAGKRFDDGMRLLLAYGAQADLANNGGETPLIRAVQLRDAEAVRILLGAGADPDRTDHVAGLSARDYAKRDRRAAHIVRLIEANEEKAATLIGPTR